MREIKTLMQMEQVVEQIAREPNVETTSLIIPREKSVITDLLDLILAHPLASFDAVMLSLKRERNATTELIMMTLHQTPAEPTAWLLIAETE